MLLDFHMADTALGISLIHIFFPIEEKKYFPDRYIQCQ